MLLAPALGIACLQVLGWLCFLVAALSLALVLKQTVWPETAAPLGTMLALAAGFAAAGLGCWWGSRKIARAAGQ